MGRASLSYVLAAALFFAAPVSAEVLQTSSIRVAVDAARMEAVDCRGRGLKMENTQIVTRVYPHMASGMVSQGLDPRPIFMGLIGIAALVPMTVLAVPTDLLASPFRKKCDFQLVLDGRLIQWAGGVVADAQIEAEGRNVVRTAGPGGQGGRLFTSKGSAVSDVGGKFSLTLDGHVGRDGDFEIGWTVRGVRSGGMRLTRAGKRFVLTEPEPSFGTGAYDSPPIVIEPFKKGSAPQ